MTTEKSADIEIELDEKKRDGINEEEDIMGGYRATVDDISRIVHKGKKILSLRSIRRRKPRLIRKLYFYWIALV